MGGKTLMDMLIERLDRFESKLDSIMNHGCIKAESHERVEKTQTELSTRVRVIEERQAEGRGKLVVAVAVASVLVSAFLQWIGKHI